MPKKIKEVAPASLLEAYPQVGMDTLEDYEWRPITQHVSRDLQPLMQDRMQDIAVYLYDSNPIAHRIIELTKDFVVGDGFTFKANDPKVQKVLDDFWNDPVNNFEMKQDNKVKELSLFGEQIYPVFVNKHNGHVRLGYIDPTMIKKVKASKKNPEVLEQIILKQNAKGESKAYNVINFDDRKTSETNGKLVGEIFYFSINKVSSSLRGRSDLLCLSDWIDGYDQFLFARLERANILNAFVWDVELQGANEKTLEEFLKKQATPKSGSIRAHNEKVKWTAVTPKLEANDASNEARLFKMQILGGAGYPEHWFAEGSTTTRATALEMGLPTFKKLKNRQKFFKLMFTFMFNFVIDQAIIAGTLDEKVDKTFQVIPPELIIKEKDIYTWGIERVSNGLAKAQELGWVTKEEAAAIFLATVKSILGVKPEKKEEEND